MSNQSGIYLDLLYSSIATGTAKKGDVLGVARIAAIQGAKRCADLVPLCHPLPIRSEEHTSELQSH